VTFAVQPSDVVAGANIAPAVQVKVADSFGNGVSGASVSLALVGTGTLTGGGAILTNGSGFATFSTLSVDLIGSKQLTATSGALPTATSTAFTVSAAAASVVSFAVQPSDVVAGASIAPAVQVKVADSFGNGVSGAPVALSLVGTGTLSGGAATATDATGTATFAGLSVDLAGAKQLTASSGALPTATSTAFNVSAAAASVVSFAVQPSDVVAGASIAPAVQVKVADSFGNGVPGASVALSLVGTGTLTGGDAVLTDASGIATFPALSVNLIGGKQLTATSGLLPTATSTAFTVSAATASVISFAVQPSDVVAGVNIAPAVQVRVADSFGNSVPGASVAVSLVGTGTLTGGGPALTDASGIATFSALSVDLAGSKQLTASSGALPSATSTVFNVSAAAASVVSFAVQPSDVVAGATMSPAVQVKVADGFGNGIEGESVALSLVGTGSLSGGGAVLTNAGGIATFPSLVLSFTGTKQLNATSGAIAPVTSASFEVSAAAASAVSFVVNPTNVIAGATISPEVQVKIADSFGNGVPGASVALGLVGTGILTGGATVATDGAGIAHFASLSVDLAGTKRLTATSGALPAAASALFTVSPATASAIAFAVEPTDVLAGEVMTPAVQVKVADSFGNGVPGASVALSLVGPGTLAGGGPLLTGSDGVATFTTLVVTGAGNHQLTAASGVLSPVQSASFVVGCAVLTLSPATLPDGDAGQPYSVPLSTTGGVGPYGYTVSAGALPAGLSLSAGGVLSGTPQAPTVANFTVTSTDASGCTGEQAYTLTVLGVPDAVTDLQATGVVLAPDSTGICPVRIQFSPSAFTTSVEVYRAPFGAYPLYDGGGGATPAAPSYPPAAPWELSPVTASGQLDHPPTRDSWSYVVFLKNAVGQASAVSNQTPPLPNYVLGDVTNRKVRGHGDNLVDEADLSLLGAHYGSGATAMAAAGVQYLDVGPTADGTRSSRPLTDGILDFEDLFLFATGFTSPGAAPGNVVAGTADRTAGEPERVVLQAPSSVAAGETFTVRLTMQAAGRVQGLSAQLAWNPSVAVPVSVSGSDWVGAQGGIVLSSRAGDADVALLGLRERGLSGEGELASFTFRALRAGDPHMELARLDVRDAANRPLPPGALATESRIAPPAQTLLLAPAPNPSRGPVSVSFTLSQPGRVELSILSVDGRRVRTLRSGELPAGAYDVTWSGDDDAGRRVAPGVYFTQLVTHGRHWSRKIVQLQ